MANKSSRSTIAAPALVELLGPLPDRVTSAWVSSHIMALVAEGRLRTGSILPSERSLAITLDVSRGTVTRAMEQLLEHDMLDSKRGSGHRVRLPKRAARPVESLDPHPTLASNDAIDLRWTVMPPHPLVQECATAVASGIGSITSLGASPAQGVPELIDAICQHYNRRGLPTSPEQVVVTNGVISGLHLSLIAATRPGALVGVENPTYPNIPRVVNTERRRITPLDVASGFPAALTAVLHSGTLDAAIITPDFHNPTGHVLSEAHRTNILRAAAVSRTPLIIDESLVTFNWRGKEMPPPMVSTDRDSAPTFLVGGTSKSLWAGLRVGWIRTSRRATDALANIRLGVDLGAPVIEQLMAAQLMNRTADAQAPSHAELITTQYRALTDAMARHLPHWTYQAPEGGLSLWCQNLTLPAHELVQRAKERGVELLPGVMFSPSQRDWSHALRLPFTSPVHDLEHAVEILGELDRL